ncbi:MAG: 2-oxoacid:acceptor oxidoreductase family protein [Chloroflexi bacterium]|nr:2-oxoacid:acceptor oxidoreductase family protein [Chloroflexota bacterium]
MLEVLIYGRGGQGNVTAAEILAGAAFEDGLYSQGYPFFGSERMGSPVQAYVRLDQQPIRLRSQIRHPDILLIQDETLATDVNILGAVKAGGTIIANTRKRPEELQALTPARVWTLPALQIAMDVIGRPNTNVVMLGAFAAITGAVSLEAIQRAARRRFPGAVGERNCEAARRAYELALTERKGHEADTRIGGAARH